MIPILFDVDESRAAETHVKKQSVSEIRSARRFFHVRQFISERGRKRDIIIHERNKL